VSREGGEAHLITSGTGTKTDPVFSPDGSMIAFTGDYDGNVDVYVMPSAGRRAAAAHTSSLGGRSSGVSRMTARRCSSVLRRNSYSRFNRLFAVFARRRLAARTAAATAEFGAFSADGKHIAYVPVDNIAPPVSDWLETLSRREGIADMGHEPGRPELGAGATRCFE